MKLADLEELNKSPIFNEIKEIQRLEEYLAEKKSNMEKEYQYWIEKNG